jgi:hypothetical protein
VPWVVQAVVGLLVLLLIAFLLGNLIRNLTAAGLLLSWRWLQQPAGFDISESVIPFNAQLPYWRALAAGLVNTIRAVLVGLVGAPGQAGSAIFQMGDTSTNVNVGEPIGSSGWRLKAADGDSALIERGTDVRRIAIVAGG